MQVASVLSDLTSLRVCVSLLQVVQSPWPSTANRIFRITLQLLLLSLRTRTLITVKVWETRQTKTCIGRRTW